MTAIQLAGRIESASPDQRTIAGRLVSFGEAANPSVGPGTVTIAPGAVRIPEDVGSVVLNVEHDKGVRIGRLMLASEHEDGIDGVFSIVKTTTGDDILAEAKAGLRNGFSIEGEIKASRRLKDGTVEITQLDLTGAAVTYQPAFTSAQIYEIAASMAEEPEADAPTSPDSESAESAPLHEGDKVDTVHTEAVEASAAVVPTAPLAASVVAPKVPTFGEYLVASALGTLEAVVDPQILAENPGIVPEPIVGPVIDTRRVERPIVDSVARVTLPAGKVYTRPIVTQHTLVGLQADELDELVGQPLQIDSITCTKKTAGGRIELSMQNRDWTSPAVMGYLGASLIGSMINFTEAAAAAVLEAAAVDTEALPANADSAQWATAVANADAAVLAACGSPANTLYVSPDVKARLVALVDTAKRPIFANLGPSNNPGTIDNPWGLRLVVSSALTAGTAIVGNSNFIEFGEDADISITQANAKTLGMDMALGRYYDVYATVPGAFVSLEPAA